MNPSPLIDLITALWFGFIGACVGSFLNVVAYRMPLGISVVWKPSHCPKCKHPIRAYDNVPVLGWLWLRGKCRDCSLPISPRYAIVEFIMGLSFFVLAYAEVLSGGANLPGGPITEFTGAIDTVLTPYWPLLGIFAYHGLLLSLLMSIALIDIDGQKVPRSLFWFGAVIGIIVITMGVYSEICFDIYQTKDWKKNIPLSIKLSQSLLSGAVSGFIAGNIISALRKGNSNNAFVFDPTTTAYTLAGLYLGSGMLFYAFVIPLLMLLIAKALPTIKTFVTPTTSLFVAVVVIIATGKQLDNFLF